VIETVDPMLTLEGLRLDLPPEPRGINMTPDCTAGGQTHRPGRHRRNRRHQIPPISPAAWSKGGAGGCGHDGLRHRIVRPLTFQALTHRPWCWRCCPAAGHDIAMCLSEAGGSDDHRPGHRQTIRQLAHGLADNISPPRPWPAGAPSCWRPGDGVRHVGHPLRLANMTSWGAAEPTRWGPSRGGSRPGGHGSGRMSEPRSSWMRPVGARRGGLGR